MSVLVAANPEWVAPAAHGGVLAATAVGGVRALSEAGGDNLRLLNFNIFPLLSCAQVAEGVWDFALVDAVVVPFLDAALGAGSGGGSGGGGSGGGGEAAKRHAIVDIETSPQWMWEDAGACRRQSPTDGTCDGVPAAGDNATCADASGDALRPGPRTRCPHWGDTAVPRDRSWRELASYFARVAAWYTRGGFFDERSGVWRASGHRYDEEQLTWEVWNEVSHSREHGMSAANYTALYDATAAVLTGGMGAVAPGGPWRGKLGGPSASGLSAASVERFLGPLLNASTHSPPSTRLDALSFHQYAMCDDPTPAGLEPIFPRTRQNVPALAQLQRARDALRPAAQLHLAESGILCNSPPGCSGNNYSCYYTSADFTRGYWVASAAQWLYQFLLSAEAADLATVAQSQLLGYPAGFDGLSGEWPCGSMVDWDANALNHKFWVQIALLQSVARPFSYCRTNSSIGGGGGSEGAAVYAQGLSSAKGRVLVLINTKAAAQTVSVAGAAGKHAATIDGAVGNAPARESMIGADTFEIAAFATVLVHWQNASAPASASAPAPVPTAAAGAHVGTGTGAGTPPGASAGGATASAAAQFACHSGCPLAVHVTAAAAPASAGAGLADGSRAAPLTSVHDARAAIDACAAARRSRSDHLPRQQAPACRRAVVWLGPGVHFLGSRGALQLDGAAPASRDLAVEWRAAQAASTATAPLPLLSGGAEVTGWTEQAPGHWAAPLAPGTPNPKSVRRGQQRLPQALFPAANASAAPAARYLFLLNVTDATDATPPQPTPSPPPPPPSAQVVHISVDAMALPPSWREWSNLAVFVYPLNSWVGLRLSASPVPAPPIDGAATAAAAAAAAAAAGAGGGDATGVATFRLECPDGCAGLERGNRIVFAGAPALLGAPGSSGAWAFDPPSSLLHVLSAAAPEGVFVPGAGRLLTIEGRRAGVVVDGLAFADTDFSASGVQTGFNVDDSSPGCPHDAAVAVSRSSGVRISNCSFVALGGGGVLVGNGSTDVAVLGSTFRDIGQSAVMFVGNATTQASGAVVANNSIVGVGQLLASAGGVLLTSASNVLVSGNNISQSGRWGIALRSNAGAPSFNNTIELNRVTDTGLTTADFGAISLIDHTAGHVATGNVVRHNCVRRAVGMRDDAWQGGFGELKTPWWGRALYLDDQSSSVAVEGNVFADSSHASVFVHGGSFNSLANNVFAGAASSALLFNARDNATMLNETVQRNAFVAGLGGSAGHALERFFNVNNGHPGAALPRLFAAVARNAYSDAAGRNVATKKAGLFAGMSFADWTQQGRDNGSLVNADPGFVDAAGGNWQLRPDSPLPALGFEALRIPSC